jgi:predicted PurR-regulated permease PerM
VIGPVCTGGGIVGTMMAAADHSIGGAVVAGCFTLANTVITLWIAPKLAERRRRRREED